jgi:hypothetical protein
MPVLLPRPRRREAGIPSVAGPGGGRGPMPPRHPAPVQCISPVPLTDGLDRPLSPTRGGFGCRCGSLTAKEPDRQPEYRPVGEYVVFRGTATQLGALFATSLHMTTATPGAFSQHRRRFPRARGTRRQGLGNPAPRPRGLLTHTDSVKQSAPSNDGVDAREPDDWTAVA